MGGDEFFSSFFAGILSIMAVPDLAEEFNAEFGADAQQSNYVSGTETKTDNEGLLLLHFNEKSIL